MTNNTPNTEISLSGSPGCPGIVIGETSLYHRSQPRISEKKITDEKVNQHLSQFRQARSKAKDELQQLLDTQQEESSSQLIDTQIQMLKDPDLSERVEREIREHNESVDNAIQKVFERYLEVIRLNHDEAFLERSVDIADVRDRLIQIIHNYDDEITEGTILVAKELSPREIIAFANKDIKGIIMDHGGTTSHAAIIARSMNIPTVVGIKNATKVIDTDDLVILDGRNGEVIVNPGEEIQQKYQQLIDQQVEEQLDYEAICQQPDETTDGHPFTLRANIEFPEELSTVEKFHAKGIGLLRTESVYLQDKGFVDKDHQESFYQSILQVTDPDPVIIRLFDVGGDKFFLENSEEQNPFLGWRGIRMLLDEDELLDSQLRAILVTAVKYPGRIRILVPMVSTIEEINQLKNRISRIQQQLKDNGNAIDSNIALGVMVEIPNVALQAELYAEHVDFLSIGTNDLTQYLLAVDRGNERISSLYDQRHPALWHLINKVAQAGKVHNIPVSVCGELASDPVAACCLLGLGINELSMNPVILPSVKQVLVSHSYEEMRTLSENVLAAETVEQINDLFTNWQVSTNGK